MKFPGYCASALSSAVMNIFVGLNAVTVSNEAFSFYEINLESLLICPIFLTIDSSVSIQTT